MVHAACQDDVRVWLQEDAGVCVGRVSYRKMDKHHALLPRLLPVANRITVGCSRCRLWLHLRVDCSKRASIAGLDCDAGLFSSKEGSSGMSELGYVVIQVNPDGTHSTSRIPLDRKAAYESAMNAVGVVSFVCRIEAIANQMKKDGA
jgi:hypothetical protein